MWYFVLGKIPNRPPAVIFRQCRAAIFAKLPEACQFARELELEDAQAALDGYSGAGTLELRVVESTRLFGVDLDSDVEFVKDIEAAWNAAGDSAQ